MLSPAEILSDTGPLVTYINGFSVRPQQQALAEAIATSLAENEALICEAGTGTGKTFAYLIAVILSGKKVIISTGTKHLQDQLFRRDLPLVQKALNIPVHAALLKGRANYLCLQRLHSAETDSGFKQKKMYEQIHNIKQWSQQTQTGDLAEVPQLPENSALGPVITSTTENCLGQECEFYDRCFVFKARQQAQESDLIIVNHHLFLSDMVLREQGYGELLPTVDVVIFDEAHQLPALASEFFSQTLSSHQLFELSRDCKLAYFAEAADLPEYLEVLEKVELLIRQLRLSFGQEDLRIAWHDMRQNRKVMITLNKLVNQATELEQILKAFAERGKQLDNCYKRLKSILNMLDSFSEGESGDDIQWLEIRGKGFFFNQTPLDITDNYQRRMADYECNAIYTSATLTVDNNFHHFAGQLGLQQSKTITWDSPFDFKKQSMLYLPEGLPDPRDPVYTERVVEKIIPVLNTTQGRAFFLFTSHRALNVAKEMINNKIDYPVLVQGEAPRTELLETFRSTKHAVLLGTSSFWEGVDVKGQALSCVIIDKLPFTSPDDPVLQARMKKLEEQGGNAFMQYQLPEAVITLKQGIGRLIRDQLDYGVLVICDPRLKTKSYGKVFLRSVPEMQQSNTLSDVENFFSQHESVR